MRLLRAGHVVARRLNCGVIRPRAMDTPLADRKGVLVDVYGNVQFSRDVIARFPSVRDLELDADLLHGWSAT